MTAAPPPSAMPLPGGLVLLVATGFVDAYVFLAHGHVFAEAMTGNLVLIGVGIVDPSIVAFWSPLLTYVAFVVGVAAARELDRATRPARSRVPQLTTLVFEIVVLVVVGFLPSGFPESLVACAVAFAAGLQISTFNHVGASRFTSVVMTSNTLATVQAVLDAVASRSAAAAGHALRLASSLAAFVVGAVVGALVTEAIGGRAAWCAAALFAVAALAYLRGPATRPTRS